MIPSAVRTTRRSRASLNSLSGVDSVQRMRPVLGTLCVIQVGCDVARLAADALQDAIDAAFMELQRIEHCMHPTKQGSDLALLAASARQAVVVDASTYQVLSLAKQLHYLSGGYFDPCLPQAEGCLADVELLADNHVLCHRQVVLDLGGIAKGYAIDRAVNQLRAAGCDYGMVNAGGDIFAFGQRTQSVAIRMTSADSISLELRDQAVAVSDALTANHPAEFQGYYVRDGYGRGTQRFQQAAIVANSAMLADALTKCALLCDATLLADLLDRFDAKLIWRK